MIALILAIAIQAPMTEAQPGLMLARVGRFAVFADASTIRREGDAVELRALQLAERGFTAGATPFLGGWSWWRIDCAARTADRLDFASLRVDRTEGPSTPDGAPPRPIAPDGDAAALADIACAASPPKSARLSLDQAIAMAHAELADR